MKLYVYANVLLLTLSIAVAVETVRRSCESKVELRAVLLSCPIKDTGCDDDDPLSQAMAAEEAQIFQSNPKNYRSLKDEKERGFPNVVKDCKRKLIITLKIKNAGKIPCDDEYIVVDHVFDPLTGGRGRLLTPIVLKLRQEQMIQLYGLQFQRVVNSDPFEEERETEKICSVGPDNPTCGIAMYNGKPIPFSEGFCCSCDPTLNAKRQLSAVPRGDSFIYRDFKLISQKNSLREKPATAVNPSVINLRRNAIENTVSKNFKGNDCDNDKEDGCLMKELSYENLPPNYLMEHDRKIICDKSDFLQDLCELRDEKKLEELKDSRYNLELMNKKSFDKKQFVVDKIRKDKISAAQTTKNNIGSHNFFQDEKAPNAAMSFKNLRGTLKSFHQPFKDYDRLAKNENNRQINRGKRENAEERFFFKTKENFSREKLDKKNSKNLLSRRRKRLLTLFHNQFLETEIPCRDAEGSKISLPKFPRDNYMKIAPPKYFFFHDKNLIHPQGTEKSTSNSTCGSSNEMNCGSAAHEKDQTCTEYSTKEDQEKASHDWENAQNKLTENINSDKLNEKLIHRETKKKIRPKFSNINSIEKSVITSEFRNIIKSEGKSLAESSNLKNGQLEDKRLRIKLPETEKSEKESKATAKAKIESLGVSAFKMGATDGKETARPTNTFDVKNIQNYFMRGDKYQNLLEPKTKSFFLIKKRGKQKFLKTKGFQEKIVDHTESEEMKKNFIPTKGNLKSLKDNKFFEEKKIQAQGYKNGKILKDVSSGNDYQKSLQKNSEESELPILGIRNNANVITSEMNHELKFGKDRYKTDHFSKNPLHEHRKHFKGGLNAEINGRCSHPSLPYYESQGNVDFNFEIIRKPIPQLLLPLSNPPNSYKHLKSRVKEIGEKYLLQPEMYITDNRKKPVPNYHQYIYVPQSMTQNYFMPIEKKVYNPLSRAKGKAFYENLNPGLEVRSNHDFEVRSMFSPEEKDSYIKKTSSRLSQMKHERRLHRKPISRRYYIMETDHNVQKKYAEEAKRLEYLKETNHEQNKNREYNKKDFNLPEDFEHTKKLRLRRQVADKKIEKDMEKTELLPENSLRTTKESFKQDFDTIKINSLYFSSSEVTPNKLSNKAESPSLIGKESKDGQTDKLRNSVKKNLHAESSDPSKDSVLKIFCRDRLGPLEKVKMSKNLDLERLKRSYATAADYVIKNAKIVGLKGKRQANEKSIENELRINPRCLKNSYVGDCTQETAHCMRFGDLWYSVYLIKKPVVAQIVGLQVFDKHGLCDGSTQWRDLTKGKMIRIGTFLPKAEDELPTISISYVGGKTKKSTTSIDPDNYLLLIPSHVSDPAKASYYPQFDGGPEEYLLVDSKQVSKSGNCNMVGTSFEAFARQPDRCSSPKGSCLKRQPVDLWREDIEARIRGKRGKYFVENFGTIPNSPIKTYTNMTGEFLALEYYGEYTSTIEIEVKADFNAMVRKGSNAQIPTVYIDGTYPKKTRIILSVLNIGLTSSYFRPRLGDCPPDLDPAWCPLEGPLVTIPPQQRHDFRLDLSGALPPNKIHVTVQVLNQLNKKVAFRKIVIKKGDRCVCAFHCKCNCINNADGRTCHRLTLEEYRGAGYVGSFPFRGPGASSASESIRTNFRIIFLTAAYVLFFMGAAKGIIGIFHRRMGIAGMRVMVGPRKISKYYEKELECCPVLFDDCGFPVHPTTCLPVQIVPLWTEILINFLFFFLYPLRGIWFLLLSQPCCTVVVEMCDGSSGQSENSGEQYHKCSSPLLSKNHQTTCVNYTMTTINARQSKGDGNLSYLPYKGDDDPLEDDDTEFVLQEMKRYRKKVALI